VTREPGVEVRGGPLYVLGGVETRNTQAMSFTRTLVLIPIRSIEVRKKRASQLGTSRGKAQLRRGAPRFALGKNSQEFSPETRKARGGSNRVYEKPSSDQFSKKTSCTESVIKGGGKNEVPLKEGKAGKRLISLPKKAGSTIHATAKRG